MLTGYLAFKDYLEELKFELGTFESIYGDLIISEKFIEDPIWAQNVWKNIQIKPMESIGDGVKILKPLKKIWTPYSYQLHRRTELIAEQINTPKKEIAKPFVLPSKQYAAFTLIEKNQLLFSVDTTSPFPNGEINFLEDKKNPPSRAYLKLWNFFTLENILPTSQDVAIDLGSSPGGWTWVLANLAKKVYSVDKAPLDKKILSMKSVDYIKESAFAIDPKDFKDSTWIFSDIICYPERLLELAKKWTEAFPKANFAFTIKFQGKTDHGIVQKFLEIPNSRAKHLFHNKHELMWFIIHK